MSHNEPVKQQIGDWNQWPDDVFDRLRAWNRAYLLSWRRQSADAFLCGGCGRWIEAHTSGDAVIRAHRKAHGVLRCEDCLIGLARANKSPPEHLFGRPKRTLEIRLREHIARLEKKILRLKDQLRVDQAYMDRLEEEIPVERLAAIHDELRGRDRRQP